MPASPRWSITEILLGLAFTAAIVAVAVLGLRHWHVERFWKKRQEIVVVFENVGGLTHDAPVRYNGIEVGRVKSIEPFHLDQKKIDEHFRPLLARDLNNLPIRDDVLKSSLREIPEAELNKAIREKLLKSTMVKVELEVLSDDDPIRYRIDDEVRIVKTIFGDTAVEMISGGGPIHEDNSRQYLLGNAGDFLTNIKKSMSEIREIFGQIRDVLGPKQLENIANFEGYFGPIDREMDAITALQAQRLPGTIERFSAATRGTEAKLTKIRETLESFQPAAEKATASIQEALKGIKEDAKGLEADFTAAKQELTREVDDTTAAMKVPYNQILAGVDDAKGDFFKAKTTFERMPGRIDSAIDPLGSIPGQSEEDLERFGKAVQKSIFNLKVAGLWAKENKDLMLSNRDLGEFASQTVLDIQRRLGAITRRTTQAGGDVLDAALSLSGELAADPVIGEAQKTAKALEQARAPLDDLRDTADRIFLRQWTQRKRAAWPGEGPIRWE